MIPQANSQPATRPMDLHTPPDQAAFRREVRQFIEDRLPAEIRERLRLGHPPRKQDTVTWQRILNEKGWAAPHWPREYGGAAQPFSLRMRCHVTVSCLRGGWPRRRRFRISAGSRSSMNWRTSRRKAAWSGGVARSIGRSSGG